jgi:MoaA/NifB/PqqE/SkfB family radical SAM enzyme
MMGEIRAKFWEAVLGTGLLFLDIAPFRGFLLRKMENYLWQRIVEGEKDAIRPAQELKFYFIRNLLRTTDHHLRKGWLHKDVFHKMVKVFVKGVLREDIEYRERKKQKGEDYPTPSFIVISPTQACNLQCPGCYALSGPASRVSLPWSVVSRILDEKTRFWHSHFTVVSGGEPFMWRSEGKDLLDLAERHNDNFFMVYTNGTLIDEKVAERLRKLGNFTPVISVEGFEENTDRRRGKGTFKKILRTFKILREYGVPFGISVVAEKHNWDEVTSWDFLRFFFDEEGAFYGWLFQYMPIGRGYTLENMVGPEERLEMFRRNVEAIKAGYNYIDFWNQGPMTDGCLAAGRSGGYLYIDWKGDVMPCVFIPYKVDNILEIYQRGGGIDDLLNSDFFRRIRSWQDEYALKKPPKEKGNLIMPCPIRDHHDFLWNTLKQTGAKPTDEAAEEALFDESYHWGLIEYDKALSFLLDPIWEEEFLKDRFPSKKLP